MREPVPGQPMSALDAFAYTVHSTRRQVAGLVKQNPPQRPVPIFRIADMDPVVLADGPLDLYSIPAPQGLLSVQIDVVLPAGTYGTIAMGDPLGRLDDLDLLPGSYLPATLNANRVAQAGALVTITATVTAGSGTMQVRVRSAFG